MNVTPQSNVNAMQVGGTHYKADIQHWDYVLRFNLNYLSGQATKYLTRWRKKNGVEDLRKSLHYFQKLHETIVSPASELAALFNPRGSKIRAVWPLLEHNDLQYIASFCAANGLPLEGHEHRVLLQLHEIWGSDPEADGKNYDYLARTRIENCIQHVQMLIELAETGDAAAEPSSAYTNQA